MGTFTKELVCRLEDDEVLARGRALADTLAEIEVAEEAFKAARAEHKEHLEALHLQKNDLKRAIRDKQETRAVDCEEQHDDVAFKVYTVRRDTGEVVGERQMSAAERQPKLFDINDKRAKAAKES